MSISLPSTYKSRDIQFITMEELSGHQVLEVSVHDLISNLSRTPQCPTDHTYQHDRMDWRLSFVLPKVQERPVCSVA